MGAFFFKYRNYTLIISMLYILLPSPPILNHHFFTSNYYLIAFAGVATILAGQSIRAITFALNDFQTQGTNKEIFAERLVTNGMFLHCRNPLYLGNILMVTGLGLMANSLYYFLGVVSLLCMIYQIIVLTEEAYRSDKFGKRFEEYQRHVNRWLPNLKNISNTIRSRNLNWKRYWLKEYETIYRLLLIIYIILISQHPDLTELTLEEKINISRIALPTLTLVYLLVKYVEKKRAL